MGATLEVRPRAKPTRLPGSAIAAAQWVIRRRLRGPPPPMAQASTWDTLLDRCAKDFSQRPGVQKYLAAVSEGRARKRRPPIRLYRRLRINPVPARTKRMGMVFANGVVSLDDPQAEPREEPTRPWQELPNDGEGEDPDRDDETADPSEDPRKRRRMGMWFRSVALGTRHKYPGGRYPGEGDATRGKGLTGGAREARLEGLKAEGIKLPPAWTNVWINPDATASLVATGKDAKGRTQYAYSAAHSERAAAEKFARLKEFTAEVPKIRAQVTRDLTDESLTPVERDAAAVVYLIDKTGFRVGSDRDTLGDVKAHGATTLEAAHVTVKGDTTTFAFIGKKGVAIEKDVTDKRLAGLMRERSADGGRLFSADDKDVREYLSARAEGFTPKDFRTYHGTATALKAIAGMKAPTSKKEYTAARKTVAKAVAAHLGNTPAVALTSYIDPAVFGRWTVAS